MNQNTNVNLIPKFPFSGNLYFSQYDVGRVATINLVEDGTAYTIPSGATVKIQATKPSGLGFSVDCTYSGSVVTVVSTETMTNEYGRFPCELRIESGDVLLGTTNFTFNVEKSPHPEGTTDGDTESIISEITVALQNALDEISASVGPTVAEAVEEAETQMQAKAAETIASIPSDYTELSEEVANLKKNVKKYNLVAGVLSAAFVGNGGVYTITANDNARIVYFPVTSGKVYTIYKGYPMTSCRIGYSSSIPAIGSTVTNYGAFNDQSANYNVFTAVTSGYACVLITYVGDTPTPDEVLESAYAYEGVYDSALTKQTADLLNIATINGVKWSDAENSILSLTPENIIDGYLFAQVTTTITESTNKSKLSVYFPVVKDGRYTVDKKIFTKKTRVAYTSSLPKYGDSTSNYTVLDGGNGSEHMTFSAPQNGYAVLWVLDTADTPTVSVNEVLDGIIVYEGDYRAVYTQSTMRTTNNVSNGKHEFYCGVNRELSTLKAGIEKATQYMDSVLYVDAGEYDLVSEFGQSWFDSLTASSFMAGLQLKNRVHIIFSTNAHVVSHYNGNNQYAHTLYSPFNAGEYGFTIENLNLDCSNCRYCVHDERNSAAEQYSAHYINCNFYLDNTENADWEYKSHQIGGGLGTNASIIFENCTFNNASPENRWGLYYHIPNVARTNYQSEVVVKNCWFEAGTVMFDDVAGTPASVSGDSLYVVTNCSFPKKYDGTNAQGVFNALAKSYKLMCWNNEIRA